MILSLRLLSFPCTYLPYCLALVDQNVLVGGDIPVDGVIMIMIRKMTMTMTMTMTMQITMIMKMENFSASEGYS